MQDVIFASAAGRRAVENTSSFLTASNCVFNTAKLRQAVRCLAHTFRSAPEEHGTQALIAEILIQKRAKQRRPVLGGRFDRCPIGGLVLV